MVQSAAKTVVAYLAEQPAERRAELARVRRLIRKHMPKGYQEGMGWGVITWSVPLKVYPDTYNKQPLCYAALAAQRNHLSVYLMCVYGDKARSARLQAGFKAAGKKLNMGKSCIRFQKADDLALDVIGELIAGVPMDKYIAIAKSVRRK
jgi:uncharacterized protein DUF1801